MVVTKIRKGKNINKNKEGIKDENALVVPITSIKVMESHRIELDKSSVDELAGSIKTHELLSPLVVRSLEDGNFELLSGLRRLKALQMLNMTHVPIKLHKQQGSSSKILRLIANLYQENLKGGEFALALKALLPLYDNSQVKLARAIGKSESYVSKALSVADGLDKQKLERVQEKPIRELIQEVESHKRKQKPPERSTKKSKDKSFKFCESKDKLKFSLSLSYHQKQMPLETKKKVLDTLKIIVARIQNDLNQQQS